MCSRNCTLQNLLPHPQKCQSLLLVLLLPLSLSAQTYRTDSLYQGIKGYVEYLPGNMPLLFAASHGGDLAPADIPTRSCSGCVTATDLNTQELGRMVRNAVFKETGCYPHLIINRLRRSRLDANRDIQEAALGNPDAEQAWKEYHGFVDIAKKRIETTTKRGLFIDLHGHGHSIQRLELGYLLSGTTLRGTNEALNTPDVISNSSIRQLVADGRQKLPHAELIRGEQSLGTLLEKASYASVPSSADPAPRSGQDYFSGGYSTDRHGSANGGNIDAIQIECNYQGVRDSEISLAYFAESLAKSLLEYLKLHYFSPLPSCLTVTPTEEIGHTPVRLFPNPGCGIFQIEVPEPDTWGSMSIFDSYGKKQIEWTEPSATLALPASTFPNGIYWLVLKKNNAQTTRIPLIQQCPR